MRTGRNPVMGGSCCLWGGTGRGVVGGRLPGVCFLQPVSIYMCLGFTKQNKKYKITQKPTEKIQKTQNTQNSSVNGSDLAHLPHLP